ncbi:histone chaperone [Pseudogymnoascus australis]
MSLWDEMARFRMDDEDILSIEDAISFDFHLFASVENRKAARYLMLSFATDAYRPIFLDTKQTRVVKKTVPTESFFNFFSPPKAPTDEDDDDAASDVEERLELDYQLGEDIKEKLIPRGVDWFTGEALQFEEMDDDLEEHDFEDDDDEEDNNLSENHDDEDESEEDVCSAPARILAAV